MSEVLSFKMPHGEFKVYNQKPKLEFLKVLQKHTNIVINAKLASEEEIADGIVDETKTQNLCTITADCVPVAIEGKNGNAIIHAGWRGLEDQILANALIKKINPQFAYIGPCINSNNYEVGTEFKSKFVQNSLIEKENKLFLDVKAEAKRQLLDLYPGIEVKTSEICTFDSPDLHSFRQNGTSQRNWNIYIPNKI